MPKKVMMMVHTMGTLKPSDNDRYTYIAKIIQQKGWNVEIVTSDFEHHKKKYRNTSIKNNFPFKITFIHENKYSRNVSIGRILGHISYAIRLKSYLKKIEKPDVIYCAIPPTISAYITAKYAKKNDIKFVIDIQDLWPESFIMALGDNVFSRLVLKPIAHFANYVYSCSDSIIAVSKTYVERAKKNNHKAICCESVYLGVDNSIVKHARLYKPILEKPNNTFWVCYVGNIATSYDFENVCRALGIIKSKGIGNIQFIIIGDGNDRSKVENIINKYFSNTIITGYLSYDMMFSLLCQADVALNPFVKKSVSSIVNKVGDYAAAGVPVVNTLNNQEYQDLLTKYNAGLNAEPENAEDIASKLFYLYENEEIRISMGKNNELLYRDKFDRSKTYSNIINTLIKE
jgi:glycosyltransferase involved in cell wall biosynthesis